MSKTIAVAKFIHQNYVIRNIKGRDKILRLQISVKKKFVKSETIHVSKSDFITKIYNSRNDCTFYHHN